MEALLLAAAPIVVTFFTSFVKKFQTVAANKNRIPLIKAIVALLSLAAATGSTLLVGNDVSPDLITNVYETVVKAIVFYWSGSGIYLLGKK